MKSGKQATADPTRMMRNSGSFQRYHCSFGIEGPDDGGWRMQHAAGRQMAHRRKPRMRKVQATPTCCTSSFVATPMTAAPSDPPPKTTPVASPRRFRNHFNGAVEQGWAC